MSNVFTKAFDEYNQAIPWKLKVIDAYLLYILCTGILQFVYCIGVGRFPFNSFLAGFTSCVGCFVLTVSLRMHVNTANRKEPEGTTSSNPHTYSWAKESPMKAFADWLFANLILHFAVLNFLG